MAFRPIIHPRIPLVDPKTGLISTEWFRYLQKEVPSGPTAERPTERVYIGLEYFDTTLGHPIWYSGTAWVNADGVSA